MTSCLCVSIVTSMSTTIIGETHGSWTILRDAGLRGKERRVWARCACGTEANRALGQLRGGASKSCGCKPLKVVTPGEVHGKLSILSEGPRDVRGDRTAIVECACGKTKTVTLDNLLAGRTRSCGCGQGNVVHGGIRKPEYASWKSMKTRCTWAKCKEWANYGGRGIRVCERWDSFELFLADMGRRPKGHTLDRIDVNGDYTPENCQWSSWTVQGRNKRNTVRITHDGMTKTVGEWAESLGIKPNVIYSRLSKGWTPDRAVSSVPASAK